MSDRLKMMGAADVVDISTIIGTNRTAPTNVPRARTPQEDVEQLREAGC